MKAIVNVNENWGIGCEGDLLVNIPEDMKFFRAQTAGSVVIMGRKTLESFPGGKPLKGRVNLVLTRDADRISGSGIEAADVYLRSTESEADKERFREFCNELISKKALPASERQTVLALVNTPEEAYKLCEGFFGSCQSELFAYRVELARFACYIERVEEYQNAYNQKYRAGYEK